MSTLKDITLWDESDWDVLVWDDSTLTIEQQIKNNHSFVFRKAYIKRRQLSDGLFESDWLEVSQDVKSWGNIKTSVDVERVGKLNFDPVQVKMINIDGSYNPDDNEDSLWNGFANQQRSLFRIEAGFWDRWKGADGVIRNDSTRSDPTIFVGIISGNISVSDSNDVVLNIQPLTQVFRDFPANLLDGFTSTGITASQFIEILRDQTDGSGNFVFRPFFNNTTSYWEITSTSQVYTNLNTSTASDLHNLTSWDVVEKLAQSENFLAYITPTGKFRWVPKTVGASSTFSFFGTRIGREATFGTTIKRIFNYGKKLTSFYSRVAVKYSQEDTSTSFVNTSLSFSISGTNTAWNLGFRTFSIENFWIPNSAAAASVASAVFDQVSSIDNEINFSTTLIPNLNILDRVDITYDATDFSTTDEFWDLAKWDQMIWDGSRGDAIVLDSVEFKVLSISINLDNLETRFVCSQL